MRAFVIGHPVAHSRSPLLHGHWLRTYGLDGSYEAIDVAPADLATFVQSVPRRGLAGGNATVPHKEALFQLLGDRVTPEARRLGAVNTLWTAPDGTLRGHNTDGQGFVASVDEAVGDGWEAEVGTALVLGAGGAARAIVAALLDRGIGRVLVANRTRSRAAGLVALDPGRVGTAPWGGLEHVLPDVGLLVNATTLGMTGNEPLALDLRDMPSAGIVADIVYVPLETPLLASARARGLRSVDGVGMLLHQAVPGFEAWFGVRPRVTPELRALILADIARRP